MFQTLKCENELRFNDSFSNEVIQYCYWSVELTNEDI